MKESKAGQSIIKKINETNQKNLKKFKKIEEDLKNDEQDLIAKKNISKINHFHIFSLITFFQRMLLLL